MCLHAWRTCEQQLRQTTRLKPSMASGIHEICLDTLLREVCTTFGGEQRAGSSGEPSQQWPTVAAAPAAESTTVHLLPDSFLFVPPPQFSARDAPQAQGEHTPQGHNIKTVNPNIFHTYINIRTTLSNHRHCDTYMSTFNNGAALACNSLHWHNQLPNIKNNMDVLHVVVNHVHA